MTGTKKGTSAAKARSGSPAPSTSTYDEPPRGRSPVSKSLGLTEPSPSVSESPDARAGSPGSSTSSMQPRPAKRKKRSELSPSSKASHSTVEKERREAMNERFSELAAQIPHLQEAISKGKKPTKGDIVKASISHHRQQEEKLQHLSRQLEMLTGHSSTASCRIDETESSPRTFNAADREDSPSPSSADSHSTWLGQLVMESRHDQSSNESGTPLTEATVVQPSTSPFKDGQMPPEWRAPNLPDWPSHNDSGFFCNEATKDLLSSFSLADLVKDHILPVSSFSSPVRSNHPSEGSAENFEGHPLVTQRSLSDTFDADTFALLSSHLKIQEVAQSVPAGRVEMGPSYTHRAFDAGHSLPFEKDDLQVESSADTTALASIPDDAKGEDFCLGSDSGEFLGAGFDFDQASGCSSFFLAEHPTRVMGTQSDTTQEAARAFPTLLRTDKPALTQR